MFNYTTFDASKIEYYEIVPASELPPGERLFIEIEGQSLVIFNIAGQFFSIADICSHDDGPVGEGDIEGYNITCPRHGARFSIRTGEALSAPAFERARTFPVRVQGGMIQIHT